MCEFGERERECVCVCVCVLRQRSQDENMQVRRGAAAAGSNAHTLRWGNGSIVSPPFYWPRPGEGEIQVLPE
jgi:hypothetical protein